MSSKMGEPFRFIDRSDDEDNLNGASKFGSVFCYARNTFKRSLIEHENHEGFIGRIFIFASDPIPRRRNKSETWVVCWMGQNNDNRTFSP